MPVTRTRENLHVLCYQHHTEMRLTRILLKMKTQEESSRVVAYTCAEPGCLVHYSSSHGYFITTKDGNQIAGEVIPRVSCPQDRQLMYLADVRPEERSYRLWRCPKCSMSLTNQELSRAKGA